MRRERFREKFWRQPGPLKDGDTMPFGKYKGEIMELVPLSYLRWLVQNCEFDQQGGKNPWWEHIKSYVSSRSSCVPACVRHPDRVAHE
jgi:hypothetical protein